MSFQQKLNYIIESIEKDIVYKKLSQKTGYSIQTYLDYNDVIVYNDLTFKLNESWAIFLDKNNQALELEQKLDQYVKFLLYMFDLISNNDLELNFEFQKIHKQKFELYNHCKKYIQIKNYNI